MMKKIILISAVAVLVLLISLTVAISYSTGLDFDKNDPETWYEEARDGGIDVKKTEKIKVGMTYEEVVKLIGKPQRDVGSGIIIAEWDLKSGDTFDVCFNPAWPFENDYVAFKTYYGSEEN